MRNWIIKNNIVLFQRSCLSQWYGAYKGQENGQFEMRFPQPTEDGLYYDRVFKFNCAEQAMMHHKAAFFDDYKTAEKILESKDPKEQKALGRKVKNFDSDQWDRIKFEIVTNVNYHKFSQSKVLKRILCEELKNYILAEAAPWDKIWGIGLAPDDPRAWDVKTWDGENLLGKALMKVRNKLTEADAKVR